MPEYVVYADLIMHGTVHIEAESLEEAKEQALLLGPNDYEYEFDYDCVDSAEPIAVFEADEDGFMDYSRPHLEKVEEVKEGTWRRKERGV